MTEANEPLRFRFITACVHEAFFLPVRRGMTDAARMLGVNVDMAGVDDVDDEAEIKLIRQAIADGVDGIALSLTHQTAFNAVVAEALDQGIPVIGFNVDSKGTGNRRLSCVCQDLYAAGMKLGCAVKPSIRAGANVLITLHSRGISALDDRCQGIMDALKDQSITWHTVITGTEPTQAAAIIRRELEQNPAIEAILGTGQADTEGSGLAVSELDPPRALFIAGFDLSPQILDYLDRGIIAASVDQQPYCQGFYPVVQLTLYCRYGIWPSNLDAGATIICQANAGQIIQLSQDGIR